MSLRRILVIVGMIRESDDLVLRDAGLRQVIYMVHKRQLCLYGHVVGLSTGNHAHQILTCRDPWGRTMAGGHPQAYGLRPVESYLRDTGMAVPATA